MKTEYVNGEAVEVIANGDWTDAVVIGEDNGWIVCRRADGGRLRAGAISLRYNGYCGHSIRRPKPTAEQVVLALAERIAADEDYLCTITECGDSICGDCEKAMRHALILAAIEEARDAS